LEQASTTIVLALMTLIPQISQSVLQTCAQQPVAKSGAKHPLEHDMRSAVASFALAVHDLTGGSTDLTLFRAMVEDIRAHMLSTYDKATKTALAKETSHQTLLYLVRMLAAIQTDALQKEATQIFEQRLLRAMQARGEVEQDLWTLGLLKKWISFDHGEAAAG
jgi:hypothetical protein